MKLSIIIPTYNSALVISRALSSILSQSFTDYEVLVMDGSSTDNTIEIIRRNNDDRIKVYSEPDRGIYDAMNKGIVKAQGEWLYFLGSDDYLLNETVLQSVLNQNLDDIDVFYGDVETTCFSKYNQGEWTMPYLTYNRHHQCIFYRRELFDRLGLYNLRYPVLADFDFNLRWFLSPSIKSKYRPIRIAHFSDGGFSSGHNEDPFWNDFDKNILKYGFWTLPFHKRIGSIMRIIKRQAIIDCN